MFVHNKHMSVGSKNVNKKKLFEMNKRIIEFYVDYVNNEDMSVGSKNVNKK